MFRLSFSTSSIMESDTLLDIANFTTLFACMVLKFPQIFVLMQAKTTTGVSLTSLLLELIGTSVINVFYCVVFTCGHYISIQLHAITGSYLVFFAEDCWGAIADSFWGFLLGVWTPKYIVFVKYQMYYDYPPPTYLEYPILIAQDAFLLLMFLHYNGSLPQSLIYALVFVGGWQLLTLQKWVIDLAMSLCTFISAASKLAQLQCLWKSKDSARVSALSWALAAYTCVARIYTTLVTTGDTQVLVRFTAMALLNLWVVSTVLHYRRRSKFKKED